MSTLHSTVKPQIGSSVLCVIPGHCKLPGFFIPLSRYFLHIDPQYDVVDGISKSAGFENVFISAAALIMESGHLGSFI